MAMMGAAARPRSGRLLEKSGVRMPDSTIDRRRLVIPALGGLYETFAPYAYAFMRFATGAILVPHGVQKVFYGSIGRYTQTIGAKGLPVPELLAYLTFFTEFVAAV